MAKHLKMMESLDGESFNHINNGIEVLEKKREEKKRKTTKTRRITRKGREGPLRYAL